MKKNTASLVWDLALPIAESLGLILWDVRFLKEGNRWYLRITVDKDGGVSIDDCVDMHHAIDGPLDELDPIDQSYNLQVQSPGIERELTRDFHFERYLGQKVWVRLIKAFEGSRDYRGILSSYDDESVSIYLDEETEIRILKKEASWIKADDFGGFEEK
ncbi:MAG: ribosome maturation factor RimP [Clostridiales bacterium]|nr:ribosome maturation factor RimP [Clostridiales bacterium]